MTEYQTTRLKTLGEKERKGKLTAIEALQLKRLLKMQAYPAENKMLVMRENK